MNNKSNILLVSDYIDFNDIGGAARITIEHAKDFYKQGYKVFIICGAKSQSMLRMQKTEYTDFLVFNYNKKIQSLYLLIKYIKQMFKQKKIDKVFLYQPASAFVFNFLRLKTKYSYSYFSSWHQEYGFRKKGLFKGIGKKIRKYIEKKCLESAQEIIVLSQHSKEELKTIYNIEDKVKIQKPEIDKSKFYKLSKDETVNFKEKKKIPNDKKIIFTLRHLNKRTGIDILIEAVSYLKQQRNDFYVLIGGVGDKEGEYKLLAEQKYVNDVIRFEGYIKEEELLYYYNCADLFVIPTKYMEGFGLVILEAMACGVPVCGTNVGAIKELLAKENLCHVSSLELSRLLVFFLPSLSNTKLKNLYEKNPE